MEEVKGVSVENDVFQGSYRYRRTVEKETFLRESLIALCAQKGTPTDIAAVKFSDVTEGESEFVTVTGEVDLHYSCMLGTDRTEEYWDKEEYTENGVKKYRDVKKKRTVTDWKPFSDHVTGEESTIVRNDGNALESMDSKVAVSLKDSEYDECNDAVTPGRDAQKHALDRCSKKLYSRSVPSADHIKETKLNGTMHVKKVYGMFVPDYGVSYEYGGKSYSVASFACGKADCHFREVPTDSELKEKKEQNAALVKKKFNLLLYIAIGVFAVGFILGIVGGIAGVSPLIAFFPVGFLAGAGILIWAFVQRNKLRAKLERDLQEGRSQQKLQLLEKTLADKGFAPLTDEERKKI